MADGDHLKDRTTIAPFGLTRLSIHTRGRKKLIFEVFEKIR